MISAGYRRDFRQIPRDTLRAITWRDADKQEIKKAIARIARLNSFASDGDQVGVRRWRLARHRDSTRVIAVRGMKKNVMACTNRSMCGWRRAWRTVKTM